MRPRGQKIFGSVKQLTLVRIAVDDIALRSRVESVMSRKNLWNKSVPRVELDQRAREARLRLARIERPTEPHPAATSGWFGRRPTALATLSIAHR